MERKRQRQRQRLVDTEMREILDKAFEAYGEPLENLPEF